MNRMKRTSDIYERIGNYPQPPLIPIPDLGNIDSLRPLGFRISPLTSRIVNLIFFITGFKRFTRDSRKKLDFLMRTSGQRDGFLFAPVISATLALEDDPDVNNPFQRAASLILAVHSFYIALFSGRLKADKYKNEILEMGQYPNFFSTSLVVNGRKSEIFKSASNSCINMILKGNFYSIQVGKPDSRIKIEYLIKTLEIINEINRFDRDLSIKDSDISAGILTSANHKTQIASFNKIKKDSINQSSLKVLENGLFTLCLDLDDYPVSYSEAAYIAHSCNQYNRWHHSSLQLVVFGNGKSCAICNFSAYIDGNTMMRGASEIQKRAKKFLNVQKSDFKNSGKYAFKKLDWNISKSFIERSIKDFDSVRDNQKASFEILGYGKKYFRNLSLEPIPTFVIALQLLTRKITGKNVRIEQFLSLSKYRYCDLTTAIVSTPENNAFIVALLTHRSTTLELRTLLGKAFESQKQECRLARTTLGIPALFIYYLNSRRWLMAIYIRFMLIFCIQILRIFHLIDPVREVIISHPNIYNEIPIVGRPGIRLPYVRYFGLHYQFFENKLVLTLMPAQNWIVPNAVFVKELEDCLNLIASNFG